MLSLREGKFHKKRVTAEDVIIKAIEFLMVVIVLLLIAKVGVDAWIKEDILRVEKLQKHFYDVSMLHNPAPSAPTGLHPLPSDLAVPRTKVFQDASQKKGGK